MSTTFALTLPIAARCAEADTAVAAPAGPEPPEIATTTAITGAVAAANIAIRHRPQRWNEVNLPRLI
jgi:hypothetical protein